MIGNSDIASISLTEYVARFVNGTKPQDIPGDVIELGKKSILDGLAVALSGSIAPPSLIIRDYVSSFGRGGCTAIGASVKLVPRFAALSNGVAMHADDYDDTLQAETGRYQGVHVTAPVLSAVLAAAEHRGSSGSEMLTAYHVGVEVAGRIFDATHINHSLKGFHATATCGMLGAAAAVSRLMGLDVERTRLALGLAGSQAAGLLDNIGSMTKPFHAGRSAECAIVANDLVERGFTASSSILESPLGFYMAHGGAHEDARIRGRLGNPWSFADRGISLKPFPNCALTHPALSCVCDLVGKEALRPDEICRIRIRTSQNIYDTLRNHAPTDELAAKFSMEFCIATMLHEKKCSLNEFSQELVNRADIRKTMALINYKPFDDSEATGYSLNTTFIEIDLMNGKTMERRADWGKGSKANPMSMEEVEVKFLECAQFAQWPVAKSKRAIEAVRRLEMVRDVKEVTLCLANDR